MNRIGFAVLIALLAGCETRIYQIRLEPGAGGLQRTLTVWTERQGRSTNVRWADGDINRLASLYAEHPSVKADVRQTFRGTFADRMPADVGGHGKYRTAATPLGTAHWYLERFRGTTDPDAELYDRRAAVDRLVDLVVGWFDEQLKDKPHAAPVHRFLHQDFRQDVRNIALYFWIAASDDRPEAAHVATKTEPQRLPDALLSAVQYLDERDYLKPNGIGSLEHWQLDNPTVNLTMLRRLLARKSQLDESQADKLFPFLVDPDAVAASWRAYLKKTPEYERTRKAWKPDPAKPAEVDGPDPALIAENLAAEIVAFDWFEDSTELRLTLVVPRPPHETNGEFDESGGLVSWHKRLHGRRELPTVCYASWSVPDEKFQSARFGKTALEGETLARFAALYSQLPGPQQAEFAAHLKSLEPGDALRGRVRDFRFTSPADGDARHVAERMLDVLYESL
jgi:hypothetical protein